MVVGVDEGKAPGGRPRGHSPARVAVDPRIRRRRVEIARAEGRRRLFLLVSILVMVSLVGLGWALTRSPLLDIDRIRVVGSKRTPVAEVVAVSGLRRGQAMTGLDEAAAVRRLTLLPWVESARVQRRWPSSVSIIVTERVPAAIVATSSEGWVLVDREARVLETTGTRPGGFLAITGLVDPGRPGEVLAAPGPDLLAVTAAVPGLLRDRVKAVTMAPDGGIELVLDSDSGDAGSRVRMGDVQKLGEKFRAVLTVLKRVATADLAVLDVRVPDSPVLTRHGSSG